MLRKMGIFASQTPPNGTIVRDTFSRADSTTTLGMTETGETWVIGAGTVFGISSGRAYLQTEWGNDTAYVETYAANAKISIDLQYVTNKLGGIVSRLNGTGSMIYADITPTGISLIRRASAVNTEIGRYDFEPVNDVVYHLVLTLNGDTVTVSLDGIDVITVTESYNSAMTRHGIRMNKTLYIDNFKVEGVS